MRRCRGGAVLSVALLVSGHAWCQSIHIDSAVIPIIDVGRRPALVINQITGNVSIQASPGTVCLAPPQPSVVVSAPSGAMSGQTIAVSWSSSNTSGSTPCVPSSAPINAGWQSGGAAGPAGIRNVTLPVVSSGRINQQLSMTCAGPSGTPSAVDTTTVLVSAPGSGNCSGTPSDDLFVAGFPTNWINLHPGQNFPQSFGVAKLVNVETGGVAAIEFSTGLSGNGVIETTEASNVLGAPVRISLSRCAGDFRTDLRVNQRCATVGTSPQQQLVFRVGSTTVASICTLAPNTTYYLNVTFRVPGIGQFEPGGPVFASECSGTSCGGLVVTRPMSRAEEEAYGLPEEPN